MMSKTKQHVYTWYVLYVVAPVPFSWFTALSLAVAHDADDVTLYAIAWRLYCVVTGLAKHIDAKTGRRQSLAQPRPARSPVTPYSFLAVIEYLVVTMVVAGISAYRNAASRCLSKPVQLAALPITDYLQIAAVGLHLTVIFLLLSLRNCCISPALVYNIPGLPRKVRYPLYLARHKFKLFFHSLYLPVVCITMRWQF